LFSVAPDVGFLIRRGDAGHLDPAVGVDGVGRNASGDLVRDASALANRFLWISNTREGTVSKIEIPGLFSTHGATAIAVDGRGNVWTALHGVGSPPSGSVARIDAATAIATGVFNVDGSSGTAGDVPFGVGIDFAGDVWTANNQTSNASRLHIDPTTGEPAPHPGTGDIVDVFPVGQTPDVHSDFTGLGYRRVTRPDGEYPRTPHTLPGRAACTLADGRMAGHDSPGDAR